MKNNIQKMDISPEKTVKVIRYPRWKSLATIAVCLVVILVGALGLPKYLHPNQPNPTPPNLAVESIEEMDSVQTASQAVGFEVNDLVNLPFAVDKTTYLVCWQEVAEITYVGEEQTAIYRKSCGTDDNSGNFNDYTDIKEIQDGDISV